MRGRLRIDWFMPLDAIQRFERARAAERAAAKAEATPGMALLGQRTRRSLSYTAEPIDGGCLLIRLIRALEAAPNRRPSLTP